MDKINISVTPVMHDTASCNVCSSRNYGDIGSGEYTQDIYNVRIGSTVIRLCPKCLGELEQQAGRIRRNRAFPEVFAIVNGNDFSPHVVKGKKEIVSTGTRVIVEIDAFTKKIYTFEPDTAQLFIFDTQAEAEARLIELTTRPIG